MTKHLLISALLLSSIVAHVGSSRPSRDNAVDERSPAADRVFEIRTYTTRPGRLDALNARFRNHTMRIFANHGMTSIGYWIPQDSARSRNTLVYVIAHASRAQADANWKAFGEDPEWNRVAAASEADGKIVEKIESVFALPTDYSPIK
ncbi:MAG: NIPSNAP family protein [Gemmatimonadaceae bacterium]